MDIFGLEHTTNADNTKATYWFKSAIIRNLAGLATGNTMDS